MIQLKLPVQKGSINEKNELITSKESITVYVDTSFATHARWEKYFQNEHDGDNLSVYIGKAAIWLKDKNVATAHFLDLLKIMYCFIKSDSLPDFESFLEMLDVDSASILLDKMTIILKEAGSSVGKN